MFLDLGMSQQVVETIDLRLLLFRRQRLTVLLNQAGDISILGFDDFFDYAAFGIHFMLPVTEGPPGSLGVEFVPAGVANDFLWIDRWIPDLGRSPVHPAA